MSNIQWKTQQQIDEERNAPQPLTPEQRIQQLEQENLMVMMALVDLHAQMLSQGGGNGD